jgi:hypothetical protein
MDVRAELAELRRIILRQRISSLETATAFYGLASVRSDRQCAGRRAAGRLGRDRHDGNGAIGISVTLTATPRKLHPATQL